MRLKAIPAVTLGCVYLIALGAGFFAPYNYETQNRLLAYAPPTRLHWIDEQGHLHARPFVYGEKKVHPLRYPIRFLIPGTRYTLPGGIEARIHLFGTGAGGNVFLLGTDGLGRDVFSRLLYGGQISLFTSVAATALSVGLGLVLGGFAGYFGGWVDEGIMRLAEVFLAVPWLYLLLAIRALLPLQLDPLSVFWLLMLVSGLLGWARPARLVRGITLAGRNREYVLSARGFGASELYLLRTHVLPQAYLVSITQAALYIPQYITAEVTLSFFGLGVSEPSPSWGNMLAQLRTLFVLENCWWMFAPAVALILVLAIFQWFFRAELGRVQSYGM